MSSHLYHLPTEIILQIFSFLNAKELTKIRRVCHRFKQIADALTQCEKLWKNYCKNDFSRVYMMARWKSHNSLSWHYIYRSLSLWRKLGEAVETADEFAAASAVRQEIRNFEILKDGVLGVHKRGGIDYYDLETLEPFKRGTITGNYLRYAENDSVIVILSYHLQLYVIRKTVTNQLYETNVTFDNVKLFLLVKNAIFFVNLGDDVRVCGLHTGDLHSKSIKRLEHGVMCLGYTDTLHVLTFERNIYTAIGDNVDLVYTNTLGVNMNILHQLNQYNFLQGLDWRVYFQWMYVFNHSVPEGPLRDIVTIRVYGDVCFVGSNWGVLRIYYAPYSSGEFDLYNAEPIKQYNFMERNDCPVLSTCPIMQVDVKEIEDGHMVIVAMPKKIAVLNFTHSYKRTSSVAMLPYVDMQKVLKISD